MVAKAVMAMRTRARDQALGRVPEKKPVVLRPLPTILIGAFGGLIVGMTSVGSGSLIIVLLMLLYPTLRANDLVGTDLVQAVPLVFSAALGHLIFGDFKLGLTTSLLIGSIPGVYIGARVSAVAPGSLIRRALVIVLLASGLKLLDVPTATLGYILLAMAVLGPFVWRIFRDKVSAYLRNSRAESQVHDLHLDHQEEARLTA
jgi:uncharacterized membrane protein YfcA